jgi:DNA-binding response OmpR family regulator
MQGMGAMAKVLLLEDDRDMCMLLRTLLEIEGYQVVTYDANQPPLALAMRERPDAVLLDVHLGGQDGIRILRDFRAEPRLSGLRVLMTSGMSLSDECLQAGADAFLAKPFMPDKLLALLKKGLATPPGTPLQDTEPSPSATSSHMAKFL